jgi:aminoglycoside phosphotransferase (APT) family kinase protein
VAGDVSAQNRPFVSSRHGEKADVLATLSIPFVTVTQPSKDALRWVDQTFAGRGRVVRVKDLSQSPSADGPWWLDIEHGSAVSLSVVLHLGDMQDDAARRHFATQVAALELAERHSLPAPRVVAVDLDGTSCRQPAMIETALPGSSRIPFSPAANRLRALGRAAGTIHAIAAEPSPGLPLRFRSLDELDFGSLAVPEISAELFATARGAVAEAPPPSEPHVFVHGDLWQGNTVWDGSGHWGVLDWDFAGVGPAGVDLGSLRCDVAVMYGQQAADEVTVGWEEFQGTRALNVAWWDLVACMSTPPDMAMWLPNFHHQGRADLDIATVTKRRDAFLAAALDRCA